MASTINSVIIQGNLTRDPELRHTPSGTPVANARIAHNDRVKRDGQWTDTPYFFDLTVWGNSGERFVQFFTKGKPVLVKGRLTWREWEQQDGTKRQAVEIVADEWFFVGPKGDGDGVQTRYGDADYSRGDGGGETNDFVPAGSTDFPAATDDDIPF